MLGHKLHASSKEGRVVPCYVKAVRKYMGEVQISKLYRNEMEKIEVGTIVMLLLVLFQGDLF